MKQILFLFTLLTASFSTYSQYSGGSGTVADPYHIANLADLHALSETQADWDKHFIQTDNIDAYETETWNSGAGFSPIGVDAIRPFTGTYNGNTKIINGLHIKRESNFLGLFGCLNGATVHHALVFNANINSKGAQKVGIIAGKAMNNSLVYRCGMSGYVSGHEEVGCMVGQLQEAVVKECFADKITALGTTSFGMLVGSCQSVNDIITNCFADGRLQRNTTNIINVGSLVGIIDEGTLSNSYVFGPIQKHNNTSGIVGDGGKSVACQALFEDACMIYDGLKAYEFANQSNFIGWDFTDTWQIKKNPLFNNTYSRPYLRWIDDIETTNVTLRLTRHTTGEVVKRAGVAVKIHELSSSSYYSNNTFFTNSNGEIKLEMFPGEYTTYINGGNALSGYKYGNFTVPVERDTIIDLNHVFKVTLRVNHLPEGIEKSDITFNGKNFATDSSFLTLESSFQPYVIVTYNDVSVEKNYSTSSNDIVLNTALYSYARRVLTREHQPVSGVHLDEYSSLSIGFHQITDSNGETSSIEFERDGTYYATGGGVLWSNNEKYEKSFSINNLCNADTLTVNTVTFTITDNSIPVSNASITINNIKRTTDKNGQLTFLAANGIYEYTLAQDSLPDSTGSITVNNGNFAENISVDIYEPTFQGEGTTASPYQISTLNDLRDISQIRALWNKHFILVNDIDASATQTWNNGKGFSPIGSFSNPFKGSIDGNGHTISRLYINRPEQDNVGFTGYSYRAAIKNLILSNAHVTGKNNTAILCAYSTNRSTIYRCGVSGTLIGTKNIGAIIGYGEYATINQCYADKVTITGNESVGSLIGLSKSCNVSNCFANGEVSGNTLIGNINNNYISVKNCYFFGIASNNTMSGSFTNCYYKANATNGSAMSESDFTDETNFADWDFKNVWKINLNPNFDIQNERPYLKWLDTEQYSVIFNITDANGDDWGAAKITVTGVTNLTTNANGAVTANLFPENYNYSISHILLNSPYTGNFTLNTDNQIVNIQIPVIKTMEGSGTDDDPFIIRELNDLRTVSENTDYWNKHFVLGNDIDASDTKNWNNGLGFSSIGTTSIKFTGSFNGNNNTIKSLYINRPDDDYIGFFGVVNTIYSIKGFVLEQADITGHNNIGILAGYIERCSNGIQQCGVSGSLNGYDNALGGIAGLCRDADIVQCYADFVNCEFRAVPSNYMGSLLGECISDNTNEQQNIEECFANGSYAHLIGWVSARTTLKRSYLFVENGSFVLSGGTIDTETCFKLGSLSGSSNITLEQFAKQDTFATKGWDFTSTWEMDINPKFETINQRPYLQWIAPKDVHELTFKVTDAHSNFISNAEIDIYGRTLTSDANGEITCKVLDGLHSYDFSFNNYHFTDTVIINSIRIKEIIVPTVDFELKASDGTVFENAKIRVGNQDIYTNTEGKAHTYLTNSTFSYEITHPQIGIDTIKGNITVSENLTTESITLHKALFNITAHGNGITDVTLNHGIQNAVSNANGETWLYFPNGIYEVLLHHNGFPNDLTKEITISDTESITNIDLRKVTVSVKNSSGDEMSNTMINIDSADINLNNTTALYISKDTLNYRISQTNVVGSKSGLIIAGNDPISIEANVFNVRFNIQTENNEGTDATIYIDSISVNHSSQFLYSNIYAFPGYYHYNIPKVHAQNDLLITNADTTIFITGFYNITFDVYLIKDLFPTANVQIVLNNDTTITDSKGKAHFSLYPGEYSYTATSETCPGIKTGTITVVDANVTEVIETSMVQFKVQNKEGQPVSGATISIDNISKTTQTDSLYIYPVFSGNHNYTVTHPSILGKITGTTTVKDYDEVNSTWTTQVVTFDALYKQTLHFKYGKNPLIGYNVSINNQDFTTNNNGDIVFYGASGIYNYEISKNEFKGTVSGSITVADADVTDTVSVYFVDFKSNGCTIRINDNVVTSTSNTTILLPYGNHDYQIGMGSYFPISGTANPVDKYEITQNWLIHKVDVKYNGEYVQTLSYLLYGIEYEAPDVSSFYSMFFEGFAMPLTLKSPGFRDTTIAPILYASSPTVVVEMEPLGNYSVSFVDWDNTTISIQSVIEKNAATAPAEPTRTGYTFTGWDIDFSKVSSDLTVTAQYSINSYTVSFKDYDGTELKTETVDYGNSATAPASLEHAGYTFTGWDTDFSNITSNLIVTAQYSLVSGMENIHIESLIKIYPNPVEDNLFIEVQDMNLIKNLGAGISIFNSNGKRIYHSHNIKTKQIIDLNRYPKGLYFVNIGNQTRKILVE